jgi:uncharacterized protein YbjT (DUF2867 family)
MYVITGVSGNTGKVAAEALLAAHKPVRVVVRDVAKGAPWKAKGAEVVVADLNDEAALTKALTGATGAYLLAPPDYRTNTNVADKRKMADVFARAIKQSGVKHVVLLSSVGAQHADGTGPIKTLHYTEKKIEETGVSHTFIRAAYFMENWGSGLAPAKAQGTLYTMFEGAIPMVATEDIGKVAAQSLLEGTKGVVNLQGPSTYSSEDVAKELTRIFGKPVAAVLVPEAGRVGALTGAGLTEDLAKLFAEMNGAIAKGLLAFEPGHKDVKGTITLAQVLDRIAK